MSSNRRRKRRKSKGPIIAVIILLIVIIGGVVGGVTIYQRVKQARIERQRRMATVTVTVPEGYSIDMIAQKLEEENVFKANDFLKAVKNTDQYTNDWIKDLPTNEAIKYQLEGYLYPDTYNIYKMSKPKDLIQKMLDNFDEKYNEIAKNYQGDRTMSQLVTMASIIEREASNQKERPRIAGVIENRLAKNMKLQMDPTVLYVTTNGLYDATRVYYKDLKVKSPYNTYENKGLPVGPICNPGTTALRAAMNPEKHDYLYYHTDGSGNDTHIFTKTFKEHKKTMKKNKTKE